MFTVEQLDEALSLIIKKFSNDLGMKNPRLLATGGGAFKFEHALANTLEDYHQTLEHIDEIDCLIEGLNYLCSRFGFNILQFIIAEDFSFKTLSIPAIANNIYPYILVNIGSGVSIIKVTDANSHERISGSTIGGGTFRGLLSLLTPALSFDEMLELADSGDNKKVDLLVGDIYGTDYTKMNLKSTTIASSFGKLRQSNNCGELSRADIAKSMLYMISNNISQIAYLSAANHGIDTIFFSGFFIRGHGEFR